MDVYCSKCGEPWELDTLHDVVESTGESFAKVRGDFLQNGCSALGDSCNTHASNAMKDRGMIFGVLAELGDLDGAMAEMEDLDALGLI